MLSSTMPDVPFPLHISVDALLLGDGLCYMCFGVGSPLYLCHEKSEASFINAYYDGILSN